MSSRRSTSHSTGPSRSAHIENEALAYGARLPSFTESARSLSSDSWEKVKRHEEDDDDDEDEDDEEDDEDVDDGIVPSDSASRPPPVPSVGSSSRERHTGRHPTRHQAEVHPTSSRHKSSHRIPTIAEEGRRTHRSHSDTGDRQGDRQYHEEREHHRHRREHHRRESLSETSSSSRDSDYSMSGHGQYDAHNPQYHSAPWQSHGPPPVNYPLGHFDTYGRPIPGGNDPMTQMAQYDPTGPFSPYSYPDTLSPAAGTPTTNPFAANMLYEYEQRQPLQAPAPPAHAIAQRPSHHLSGRGRPHSYAAPNAPYAMEGAMAHYYPSGYATAPGMSPHLTPQAIAAILKEMRLSEKSRSRSPDRKAKSKSPPPAAPAPPPEPEKPAEDPAEKFFNMLLERDRLLRLADEQAAAEAAAAEAAEKARKEIAEAESAKIEAMLKKWDEDRLAREQAEREKIEAARKVAEAAAAREKELADAAQAAKEAAEKAATEKQKELEEAHKKAMDEAKAAAEEQEKKAKALEEDLAKLNPQPDDAKPPVHLTDMMNRRFDVPWRFAKSYKGISKLIQEAFGAHMANDYNHIAVSNGWYDLIGGPDNTHLHALTWEYNIQPDWEIRMEVWPPQEDPLVQMGDMPGGFFDFPPDQPLSPEGKKSRKERARDSGRSGKGKKAMPGSSKPAPGLEGPMVPPPLGPGQTTDGIVYVEQARVGKSRGKKKSPPLSPFAAWLVGGTKHKSAGKDSEKPEMMIVAQQQKQQQPDKEQQRSVDHEIGKGKKPSGSNRRNSSGDMASSDEEQYILVEHEPKTLPVTTVATTLSRSKSSGGNSKAHHHHHARDDSACIIM